MLPKRNSFFKPSSDHALAAVAVFLLACGNFVAAPFVANQNQYFAHAISKIGIDAESDWFRNTTDPYPFFSAIAYLTYNSFGIGGIRILSFLGTAFAMATIFFLARLLAGRRGHSNAALLGTVAIGFTLLPHTPHAFEGVAGQYIISTPAYLQPSMFGCFLLLAIVCLIAASTAKAGIGKQLLAIAFVLTGLSCALHPTYVVSATMLLAAAVVANIWQGEKAHIFYFVSAAVVLNAIAIAANPSLLSMAFSSPEYSWAARRFAFERIPQHTLITGWRGSDILLFIIAVAAIPIADKKFDQPWLARFLAASLIIGTTATLFVQLTGQAKLALLFPWRISVFVVPIASTIVAVWIASQVEQMLPRWNWRHVGMGLASCLALFGCAATLGANSPAETDEKTALVRAVRPSGVGLVPLNSDNLRLNAPANIYVDWKSPPYASDDLIEWWHRIDQVRRFARDGDRFCSIKWHAPIRWMLLPAKFKTPSCISQWKVAGQTGKWRLLEEN